MNLKEKTSKIKAIVLDIDGVLTDGSIGYLDIVDELKIFDVKDGFGIKLAQQAGLLVGAISGRGSKANRIRAEELKFNFIYENIKKKAETFDSMLKDFNLKSEECLYIGDDIIDIPVLKKAGIGVSVGDASKELNKYCDFRTEAYGGKGAVRETIEWLLKEQGKWEEVISKYTAG